MAASTTPRKRAPRKAAAAPEPAAEKQPLFDDDGMVRPVQIGRRTSAPVEMQTLFSIDGVHYKVPKRVPARWGLRFIREAQDPEIGWSAALNHLVVDFLGPQNLRVLEESPSVTDEDVADIFVIARTIVLGQAQGLAEASDPS